MKISFDTFGEPHLPRARGPGKYRLSESRERVEAD